MTAQPLDRGSDPNVPGATCLDPQAVRFYTGAMKTLKEAEIDFLVGGAYAFFRYTGIERHTCDFDIFVREQDCKKILKLLSSKNKCRAELCFPHWLGKVHWEMLYIDVIFSSGNGVARVDDDWFNYATEDSVLGVPVKLIPAEEMIWSKGFIMERERFDGADIAHVIHARGEQLDWNRLVARYEDNWQVLLSHLLLFTFIYPAEAGKIPDTVMNQLLERARRPHALPEKPATNSKKKVCQGTLLSREQYLTDLDVWGYKDARIERGFMTTSSTRHWTAAIQFK